MADVDVLIIGAGLSGIGAACMLRQQLPRTRFAVLEARQTLGGTWDLFRYPGVRSDSDMYTLGYVFKPWTGGKALADGESIRDYIAEAAEEYGVTDHVHYGHKVLRANWNSQQDRWEVEVTVVGTGVTQLWTCRFLHCCAGYYNYAQGYQPDFPGREEFAGQFVHPQHWPEDLDYANKRVVVIGSGATAVTLVPAMAAQAARVTMLQRSPSYVLALPGQDKVAQSLRRWLPERVAYGLNRWKNIGLSMWLYTLSRRKPETVKRFLRKGIRQALGPDFPVDTHFRPDYNPWDQRLCFVPDGDLFAALRSGKADIVTDHIERITATGIRLRSGADIEADIIVSATGLDLQFLGGMNLQRDGQDIDLTQSYVYRGMMLQDLPNFAFTVGYTNASWTLKADLTAAYVCRLLKHMQAKGYQRCTPRLHDEELQPEPIIDFSSGYVQRALDRMPKQGSKAPWKLYQNYLRDRLLLGWGRLEDGSMEFARG